MDARDEVQKLANTVASGVGDASTSEAQDDAFAALDALEARAAQAEQLEAALRRELTKLKNWASEQNAGNAFADQVRMYALSLLVDLDNSEFGNEP